MTTRQAETAVAVPTRFLTTDGTVAGSQVGISTPAQARTALNVEDGATADQTNAEIKTAYEANADTNAFLDAEKTKLTGIEESATADQTAQQIATAIDADATAEATLTAALVTTAAVTTAGALMDSEVDADLKTLTLPANTTISAFGATVVDDADAEAARTTLGAAVSTIGQGQQHFFVPAGSMISRTTSGAAAGTAELATNDVMLDYMAFDAVADEHAQFMVQMPKRWNEGTIVAQFIWSHPATTTNFGVAFFLQAVAFANDDAMDTAFGTAVGVTDTGGTTDDTYITAESAAITVAGTPGDEEYVIFQVYRDVSDAADTMAVDARLHGIKIHWTSNAATDD